MPAAGPVELGQWFSTFADVLALYARQWLAADAAEDVVQDVFLELVRRRSAPENPKAWLFRCVRNRALNWLRSQRSRKKHERTQAAGRAAWFNGEASGSMNAEAVQAAMEGLTPQQREVLLLRIWAGLTLQETAETLGEPISTIHSRYVASVKAMRERIET